MKKLSTLFAAVCLTCSLFAQQKSVFLHLRHHLDGADFALNTPFSLPENPDAKVTRLQYYVSGISMTHDGGTNTEAVGKYLLINPATDSIYSLGMFDITDLTQISFKLGVDSATNHGDPTLWPSGHALALQDPSMHWGWAGGYRFIAFEGDAQIASGSFTDHFEIHGLDDKNYKTVNLPVQGIINGDELHLYVNAEYANILSNISLAGGMIEHGGIGVPAKAMSNMETLVFSTNLTGVNDVLPNYSVRVFPNPTNGPVTFSFDFADQKDILLTILDIESRVIRRETLPQSQGTLSLDATLPSGTYSYLFSSPKGIIKAGQFVVSSK